MVAMEDSANAQQLGSYINPLNATATLCHSQLTTTGVA